jgi:hypothetical protein
MVITMISLFIFIITGIIHYSVSTFFQERSNREIFYTYNAYPKFCLFVALNYLLLWISGGFCLIHLLRYLL